MIKDTKEATGFSPWRMSHLVKFKDVKCGLSYSRGLTFMSLKNNEN